MDTTIGSMIQFLEKSGVTGRITSSQASYLASSVRKVAAIEENWEQIDISQLDIEDFLQRFRNLKGLEYAPASLSEYEGRFRRALKMFLAYTANPAGWKHNGSTPMKKPDSKKSRGKTDDVGKKQNTSIDAAETSPITLSPTGVQMMDYPFPLRESIIVRLRLPGDLKMSEVERLATFMRSITVDFDR